MDTRFVILEHTVNGASHFDLMLEIAGEDLLRTLQLQRWPLAAGESCACTELPPHRRGYLDYEGEIAGGRGHVRRVAHGHWAAQGETLLLDGTLLLSFADGVITRQK